MLAEAPTQPLVDALGETVRPGPRDPGDPLVRGDTVGRFMILGLLGQGGMGVVHAAFDPELDRKVAIKLVLPERSGGAQSRARMLREAQAMARLAHPNVVAVHDVGTVDDRLWIAMEYIGGRTLTRWLGEQRRSWRQILDIFLQAGEGLRAAHAAGLVHRDFKPDNVMIGDDGRARVMDFGLARTDPTLGERPAHPPTTAANVTQIVGTPRYMAPEQWQGRVADAQADQFAFCVALWEALYGQPPFVADDVPALIYAVLSGEPRTPANSPAIPWWLRRALRRGLASAPAQRWPTMTALLAALDRRPRQRRLAIAVLALAGLGVAAVFATREPPDPCARASDPIASVWDPARRLTIEAAFHASDLVYARDTWSRIAPDLEAYSQAWAAEATATCRTSDVGRELVQLCLERRRVELRSLLDVLATATPEVVEHARQAVLRLTPPSECRDTRLAELTAALPLPADPLTVGALRERLARIAAEESAGQYDAALAAIDALQAEAAATDHLPLLAEVALRRGTLLAHRYKNAAADEALVAAITAADRSGHDLVRAEAMVARIEVAGRRLAQQDLMHTWIPMTEALVARVAPDTPLAALMWTHAGTVASASFRYSEADVLHRRALDLLARRAPDDPARITALLNLSIALGGHEQRREALAVLAEAEALTIRLLGPEHPTLITIYNTQGNTQLDPTYSPAYYEKTRALSERLFGPRSPAVAAAIANLAELQMYDGEFATARDNAARALDIISDTYDDTNPRKAEYLIGLAITQTNTGELTAARANYQRAAAIYARNSWDPFGALALSGLATTHAREHRWDEARDLYHQANAWIDRTASETPHYFTEGLRGEAEALLALGRPAEALELARRITDNPTRYNRRGVGTTRFVLARILLALGDRPAALAAADTAISELSSEHLDASATTSAIETWLAEVRTPHDPPRPPRTFR